MMTTLNNRVSALLADPLRTVFQEFDRNFGWDGATGWTELKQAAPLSLWEENDSVYLQMDVPGLTAEDLDVSVEKGKLIIRGTRRAPDRAAGVHREERFFGQFERSVVLGDSIDINSIDASLEHGVLCCKLSKKPESQRQKIAIHCHEPVKRIESS
jgi:HSP20 family protein